MIHTKKESRAYALKINQESELPLLAETENTHWVRNNKVNTHCVHSGKSNTTSAHRERQCWRCVPGRWPSLSVGINRRPQVGLSIYRRRTNERHRLSEQLKPHKGNPAVDFWSVAASHGILRIYRMTSSTSRGLQERVLTQIKRRPKPHYGTTVRDGFGAPLGWWFVICWSPAYRVQACETIPSMTFPL